MAIQIDKWFGEQFDEPTAMYHGTGWAILVAEVIGSFFHRPIDMNSVTIGFGLISGGLLQNKFIAPPKEGS